MHAVYRRSLLAAGLVMVAALLWMPACDVHTSVTVVLSASNPAPVVGDAFTVSATATRNGVPLQGRTVGWSAAPDGALQLQQTTSQTDDAGVARVTARAQAAGEITVAATVGNVTQTLVLTAAAADGPRLRLSLDPASVSVGATAAASVVLTVDGVPQEGQAINLAVSDPSVVALEPVSVVTDADGAAAATLTGLAAGSVQVLAVWNGRSVSADFTVAAPPLPEYVFTTSGPLGEILLMANQPSSTPGDPGFDDKRIPVGTQRDGSLILAVDASFVNAYVIDMRTRAETPFTPDNFSLVSASPRAALASGVTADGERVVWLRRQAAGTQIVSARLNGANARVLLEASLASAPTSMALSPNGLEVAYTTMGGEVRLLLETGNSRALELGDSTGPLALDWLEEDTLVVAVNNYNGSARPGLLSVPASGAAPWLLFNDGTGLRSAPSAVCVDGAGNVIYDELDATGSQSNIVRLDAPGYSARTVLAGGDASEMRPVLTRF